MLLGTVGEAVKYLIILPKIFQVRLGLSQMFIQILRLHNFGGWIKFLGHWGDEVGFCSNVLGIVDKISRIFGTPFPIINRVTTLLSHPGPLETHP